MLKRRKAVAEVPIKCGELVPLEPFSRTPCINGIIFSPCAYPYQPMLESYSCSLNQNLGRQPFATPDAKESYSPEVPSKYFKLPLTSLPASAVNFRRRHGEILPFNRTRTRGLYALSASVLRSLSSMGRKTYQFVSKGPSFSFLLHPHSEHGSLHRRDRLWMRNNIPHI